jgi:pectate lyase
MNRKEIPLPILLVMAAACNALATRHIYAAPHCTDLPVKDESYKIVNVGSDLLLNVVNGATTDGANINTVTDKGENSQRFYLRYNRKKHDWFIEAAHSGSVVGVNDDSKSSGVSVEQFASTGEISQEWDFERQTEGYYRIVNKNSSLSLVARDAKAGANVKQSKDSSADLLKRWWLEPVTRQCDHTTELTADDDQDSGNNQDNNDDNNTGERTVHSASFKVTGFASISGSDGLSTTTGGSGGKVVTVKNCKALKAALTSDERQIIQIPDNTTIDCRDEKGEKVEVCKIPCPTYLDKGKFTYRVPTSELTCDKLGATGTTTKYNRAQRIFVKPNKTLMGLGDQSTIKGATIYLRQTKNIIVRNLNITGVNPELIEAGDGVTINQSSHVVIDHVRFKMISDGYIDMKQDKNITVSYNHFDGRNPSVCGDKHWYTNLVDDTQVTFDHNFWDSTAGRNPKLTDSRTRAHLYNNYWKDIYYFSIGASHKAQAYIDDNYFDNSARPHWNIDGTGLIDGHQSTNIYTKQSASGKYAVHDTGKTVFNDVDMYDFSPDPADNLPDLQMKTGPQTLKTDPE